MILNKNIYLIGMPGSGKTTIGLLVSSILNCHFYETDWAIVRQAGKTIGSLIKDEGETVFRNLEEQILLQSEVLKGTVIATGGGLPCYYDNMEFMIANGLVVWLQVPTDTIIQRLALRYQAIPALADTDLEQSVPILLAHRSKWYQKAHLTINLQFDTAEKNAIIVANEIKAYLQANEQQ
jgi:shikimate kinase